MYTHSFFSCLPVFVIFIKSLLIATSDWFFCKTLQFDKHIPDSQEHSNIFTCLLVTCISSLRKAHSGNLPGFKRDHFLVKAVFWALCISEYRPWSEELLASILFYPVVFFFTLWIISPFNALISLIWYNPICQIWLLFSVLWEFYPEDYCLGHSLEILPLDSEFQNWQ